MHQAKTQLSALVARAEAGEEVVIARDGSPAVRLMPVITKPGPTWISRLQGTLAGQLVIADDVDAPVPELEALIYADDDR